MKLNREDFNKLDDLLRKIGFGSYYDCLIMIKDAIYNIEPKLQCKLEGESDLLKIIILLARISKKLKKSN